MTNEIYINEIPQAGTIVNGRVASGGWNRTDTSASGRIHVGFGTYHTYINIKFEDNGPSLAVTLVEYKGRYLK